MIWVRTAIVVAFAFLALGCDTASNGTNEEEVLLGVDREWSAVSSEGKEIDRIVAFWGDDATTYPASAPVVHGKAAIRKFIQQSLAIPGFHISWHPEQASLSVDGTLGYTTGENAITIPGPRGKLMTVAGRYLTVWRHDDSGRDWKCIIDIWNSPR